MAILSMWQGQPMRGVSFQASTMQDTRQLMSAGAERSWRRRRISRYCWQGRPWSGSQPKVVHFQMEQLREDTDQTGVRSILCERRWTVATLSGS